MGAAAAKAAREKRVAMMVVNCILNTIMLVGTITVWVYGMFVRKRSPGDKGM
jgi:hypothetical protein